MGDYRHGMRVPRPGQFFEGEVMPDFPFPVAITGVQIKA